MKGTYGSIGKACQTYDNLFGPGSDHPPFLSSPTTCYVLDHILHQIPHLGIGSYILIDVELILLVPRGVRLNPAGGMDHMAGGFLDTRVRSGTHRRQDGRAQDPRIGDLGERDGHATHVGMDLHPQLALDRAAARDDLFWDEAFFA